MCKTFKWIKLLVLESQKRWTADSYKNFFGQMTVSNVRTFQSALKMQIFDLCTSLNVEHHESVTLFRRT